MYFHAGTQGEVLRHFHFALNDHGYLFLGKSEMLTRHAELFRPMHSRMRAFEKLPGGTVRARPPAELPARPDEMGSNAALREAALDAGLVAQVVVDAAGQLVLANYEARRLFGIAMADLGQRLQDVELSYRPVELRSLIEKALAERHAVRVNDVEWEVAGREPRRLSLQLRPLPVADGAVGGVAITFSDVTSIYQLNSQLERSRHDRDTADEELQSTVEELETTNEELQSTNEELETTNEELQSTNEELETMNEELQSINAELETVNDELRLRTTELNSANSYLEGILGSLRLGVIAVDRDRMVNIWNRETEELWGLRADEVAGKDLMSLDIGFPLDRLRAPLTACMAGGEADHPVLTVPAVNRRGRKIGVRVTLTPLQNDGQLSGVIVVMESIGPGGELLEHDGV